VDNCTFVLINGNNNQILETMTQKKKYTPNWKWIGEELNKHFNNPKVQESFDEIFDDIEKAKKENNNRLTDDV
tara:strand:+ start:483 stop:701 length:219 start_codon:yes stop_codon:yes gene_type:complete